MDLWSKNCRPRARVPRLALRQHRRGRGPARLWQRLAGAPLNPLLGLHTAVTRTTPDGLPEGGWYPSERLALKSAIDAYTSGAAWASFDEQRKGTLAAGMLADLVVLSDDIFEAPPSRLRVDARRRHDLRRTIVYRRNGAETN